MTYLRLVCSNTFPGDKGPKMPEQNDVVCGICGKNLSAVAREGAISELSAFEMHFKAHCWDDKEFNAASEKMRLIQEKIERLMKFPFNPKGAE